MSAGRSPTDLRNGGDAFTNAAVATDSTIYGNSPWTMAAAYHLGTMTVAVHITTTGYGDGGTLTVTGTAPVNADNYGR